MLEEAVMAFVAEKAGASVGCRGRSLAVLRGTSDLRWVPDSRSAAAHLRGPRAKGLGNDAGGGQPGRVRPDLLRGRREGDLHRTPLSTLRTRVDAAVPGVSSRRGAGTVPLCRPSLLEMSALFIYLSSGIACHGESAQKENNNPIIRPAGCAS